MIKKEFTLSSNEIRSSGGFVSEEKVSYDLKELVETFSAKGIFFDRKDETKEGVDLENSEFFIHINAYHNYAPMVEELIGGRTCHEYGFRVNLQYSGSDKERVGIVERVVRDFYQDRLPDELRLHFGKILKNGLDSLETKTESF